VGLRAVIERVKEFLSGLLTIGIIIYLTQDANAQCKWIAGAAILAITVLLFTQPESRLFIATLGGLFMLALAIYINPNPKLFPIGYVNTTAWILGAISGLIFWNSMKRRP
jgi:hypothetical protein